ncbi:MAG: transposase [Candidatus Aminicenantes bacterium]|nr:transposase [Candidatus Aminicenantes bacterium]
MVRPNRGYTTDLFYHVLNRGNNKRKIFKDDMDYELFKYMMFEAVKRYEISIYAYCLMPNHFHFLIKSRIDHHLSRSMHWLFTTHAKRYHRFHGTVGHIWQERFRAFLVQDDNHFLTVMRYIERNPLRAQLVEKVQDWPWTSLSEKLGSRFLVSDPPVVLPKEWLRFVNQPLTDREKKAIETSLRRNAPYGETAWSEKMCSKHGLMHTIRPRGRPKKDF